MGYVLHVVYMGMQKRTDKAVWEGISKEIGEELLPNLYIKHGDIML